LKILVSVVRFRPWAPTKTTRYGTFSPSEISPAFTM
jgi:hypothetical protein